LLDDFDKAKEEVTKAPHVAPLWVSKMKDYPPGIFNICEDTLALAKEKVTLWLCQNMFSPHISPIDDFDREGAKNLKR